MRIAILISLFGLVIGGKVTAGPEKNQAAHAWRAAAGAAARVFRQMESKLGKAKTIQCEFDVILQACPGAMGSGSILLGDNNKSRVERRSAASKEQEAESVVTVSDGKRTGIIGGGPTLWGQDVPKWQNQAFKVGFGRVGITMVPHIPLAEEGKDFKADDAFRVTDFKLGEKVRIGTKEAQAIEYVLVTNGLEVRTGKTRFAVSLWLDVKTNLPLKRVVVPLEEGLEFILTETYRSLTLDEKIDPAEFELPKE